VYGYPIEETTKIAVQKVVKFLTQRCRGAEFAEASHLLVVAVFDANCIKVVRCKNPFFSSSLCVLCGSA